LYDEIHDPKVKILQYIDIKRETERGMFIVQRQGEKKKISNNLTFSQAGGNLLQGNQRCQQLLKPETYLQSKFMDSALMHYAAAKEKV
jgi:hypothetical protein